MFETTYRELTRYYVTLTIMMFALLVACFLTVITFFYYNDEKLSVAAFAVEETNEHLALLEKGELEQLHSKVDDDRILSTEEIQNALRMFSFIHLPDGRILALTYTTKNIEQWVVEQIKAQNVTESSILTYKINGSEDNRHRILFVQQHIIQDGKMLGTIYVGKDVSILWSVLKKMAIFSLFLVIIFTIFLFHSGRLAAKKAMQPVQEAIDKQKRFVTDASHELRTPLSVILTGTEVLKSTCNCNNDEKIIADVQDEIRKMSLLIDNMLNLSKLDEREVNSSTEENIVQTAQIAVDKLCPLAQQKQISLILENSRPILWQTNNDDIAQIIYILVDNAIKYTPENGSVLVFLQIKNAMLTINVEDTGIGIEENQREAIFERFYRVDTARNRQKAGSGLGLSIARSIVEKHHGTITVSSKLGKGSLFSVQLPKNINGVKK